MQSVWTFIGTKFAWSKHAYLGFLDSFGSLGRESTSLDGRPGPRREQPGLAKSVVFILSLSVLALLTIGFLHSLWYCTEAWSVSFPLSKWSAMVFRLVWPNATLSLQQFRSSCNIEGLLTSLRVADAPSWQIIQTDFVDQGSRCYKEPIWGVCS